MNKFEKLIEYIINDEEQKASDLFHEIVVEKSRSIYESLMDDDEFGGDAADDLINDIESEEEGLGEAEEDEDEYATDDEMDFDASGELDSHEEEHAETEGETDELEDRVADLENELDALMAEFDSLMGGEEGDEMDVDVDGDMEVGMDDDGMGMDDEEVMPAEGRYDDLDEAVTLTKVTKGIANSTEEGSVNKKSVNADNSGKKGAVAKPISTDTKEETGRTADAAKDMGYTPTQEAGKKAFKSNAPKPKTSGEEGGVNKKSIN